MSLTDIERQHLTTSEGRALLAALRADRETVLGLIGGGQRAFRVVASYAEATKTTVRSMLDARMAIACYVDRYDGAGSAAVGSLLDESIS